MVFQNEFLRSIKLSVFITALFLGSCVNEENRKFSMDEQGHVQQEAERDSLKVSIDRLLVGMKNDTLLCSYTVHNHSTDEEIYVNTYSWTIQNGDSFGYGVPSRTTNVGNIISLFRDRTRGSQMEYFTPAYPRVQAELCSILPGRSAKVSMRLVVQPDSLNWVRDYKAVVVGVPVWGKISDTLRHLVSIVQSDTIQPRVYRPYSDGADRILYLVKQGLRSLEAQDMHSMFTAMQNERLDHVYYER